VTAARIYALCVSFLFCMYNFTFFVSEIILYYSYIQRRRFTLVTRRGSFALFTAEYIPPKDPMQKWQEATIRKAHF